MSTLFTKWSTRFFKTFMLKKDVSSAPNGIPGFPNGVPNFRNTNIWVTWYLSRKTFIMLKKEVPRFPNGVPAFSNGVLNFPDAWSRKQSTPFRKLGISFEKPGTPFLQQNEGLTKTGYPIRESNGYPILGTWYPIRETWMPISGDRRIKKLTSLYL